jgi:GNAT superfamily N-acetyltransferase
MILRRCDLSEIAELRDLYRAEMNCQILHDSIHRRPGWGLEYLLQNHDKPFGYGSVAIAGPWKDQPTVYEFYVTRDYRTRIFEAFETFIAGCESAAIETQSNDPILTPLLYTYARNVYSESILFEDTVTTHLNPAGAEFRRVNEDEAEVLFEGEPAGKGGILWHYNRPYGDLWMEIAEPFRRKGLGSYLVQELKAQCRARGGIPAARCNTRNAASRRTLQKAGFTPCGNGIAGQILKSM